MLLHAHDGAVHGLATDGRRLFSTGEDGRVVVFDLEAAVHRVQSRSDPDGWAHPHRLVVHGERLLVGAIDGALAWWSADGVQETDLGWSEELEETLCDVAVLPDGRVVATGGDGGGLVLVEGASGPAARGETFKWPYAVAVSPDGTRLAVGTWDGRLHVGPVGAVEQLEDTELAAVVLCPVFDVAWLDPDTVVVVGHDHGEQVAVQAVGLDGVERWRWGAGETGLCLVRTREGVAVGLASGAVVELDPLGREQRRHEALSGVEGGAPFPAVAEYFDVPAEAVCALASSGDDLFAGLASGAVVQLR